MRSPSPSMPMTAWWPPALASSTAAFILPWLVGLGEFRWGSCRPAPGAGPRSGRAGLLQPAVHLRAAGAVEGIEHHTSARNRSPGLTPGQSSWRSQCTRGRDPAGSVMPPRGAAKCSPGCDRVRAPCVRPAQGAAILPDRLHRRNHELHPDILRRVMRSGDRQAHAVGMLLRDPDASGSSSAACWWAPCGRKTRKPIFMA